MTSHNVVWCVSGWLQSPGRALLTHPSVTSDIHVGTTHPNVTSDIHVGTTHPNVTSDIHVGTTHPNVTSDIHVGDTTLKLFVY